MLFRGSKKPQAAYVEEYDEDTHDTLPGTRQVAHSATSRSSAEVRPKEFIVDVGSDSGYSSRTAPTINSGQSPPSGRRSPIALKLEALSGRMEMDRKRESRKEKARKEGRDGQPRRSTLESMQDDAMRNARIAAASSKSPLKSRRRESVSIRHHPGSCWECEQGFYHPSTAIEPSPLDIPYFYQHPQSVQTVPTSPTMIHYPMLFSPEVSVAVNHPLQRRMNRSNSYHSEARPLSFHGGSADMYNAAMSMSTFDPGPPISASAYSHMLPYSQHPYVEQAQYYAEPEPAPQPVYERSMMSSKPRPKERGRRLSTHGPPLISQAAHPLAYNASEDIERMPREHREPRELRELRERRERRESLARAPSHPREIDEDYYLMPPPPPPGPKPKPQPEIIQKRPELSRKSAALSGATLRRSSNTFDLADLEAALPDRIVKRMSRDPLALERSQSMRNARRNISYHESSRPTKVSIDRGRRSSYYEEQAPQPLPQMQRSRAKDTKADMDQKQRDAEEYQAARSGKAVPTLADSLFKVKATQTLVSDSGSAKSHTSSSRNSDTHSRDGSGVGSRADENNGFTMTMNGVTMSFSNGKTISLRPGEQGGVEVNIEGPRLKKYFSSLSDHTVSSIRREIEDLRSSRDGRRSDRASRRSSRSNNSGR